MDINTSDFDRKDAFDILLQRTLHVKSHLAFRMWARGISLPLRLEAALRRQAILSGVVSDARSEFNEIKEFLDAREFKPNRVVDIGCGHGIIDLFFARAYGCELHLVDIERTVAQHHDFHASGAGYASLQKARAFLERNGVEKGRITTTNPNKQTLSEDGADLLISLLSCGFHYPAETYGAFIDASLAPGGIVIMDIRKGSGQDNFLRRFAIIETVHEAQKYVRIAARMAA